jgi:hypothetical protein
MLKLAVAEAEAESVTFTVKSNVPAAVGVPEITPVLGLLKLNPAGNVPALMLHV